MFSKDSRVINNCIEWNEKKLKNAKTIRDRKRYAQNIENLKGLLDECQNG